MKRFSVTVNGKAYDVSVEEITGGESVPAAVVSVPPAAAASVTVPVSAAAPEGSISVKAPMPGTILDIKVNAGDEVKEGQPVIVLEAMKMENDIVAPKPGKIVSVHVNKGDSVKTNDLLVSIE